MREWLARRHPALIGFLLLIVVAATAWSGITLVNAVSGGARESDAGIYWTAVAIIAVATTALVGVTLRIIGEIVARTRR